MEPTTHNLMIAVVSAYKSPLNANDTGEPNKNKGKVPPEPFGPRPDSLRPAEATGPWKRVNFVVWCVHLPAYSGTKLYRLITKAICVTNLAQGHIRRTRGWD